ncbi:transposase [Streptomyces sp. NPDC091217]|uniref:transposase n=1 Tax=Streptomyces sp. NPDC091217 TaxID=3365975 RepID=UPI003806CF1E
MGDPPSAGPGGQARWTTGETHEAGDHQRVGVLAAWVSPASVGDRDGAAVLFSQAADAFPRLRHVWADQGYRGTDFHAWAREATGITVQVVQRRDGGFRSTWAKAGTLPPAVPLFAVVPRRWVVEGTIPWLRRCRRLSKDYEYLGVCSENAAYLTMAMLPVRRPADRLFRRPLAHSAGSPTEGVGTTGRYPGAALTAFRHNKSSSHPSPHKESCQQL